MTEPLTPAQTAAAVKKSIGDFGFTWMADKAGRERGKAELGLRGRSLYHLGRAGVLGDVPVEVVIAAEAFFPPDVVRKAWEEGRALVAPADVAHSIYVLLGLDPNKELPTTSGRPVQIVRDGRFIRELTG